MFPYDHNCICGMICSYYKGKSELNDHLKNDSCYLISNEYSHRILWSL